MMIIDEALKWSDKIYALSYEFENSFLIGTLTHSNKEQKFMKTLFFMIVFSISCMLPQN